MTKAPDPPTEITKTLRKFLPAPIPSPPPSDRQRAKEALGNVKSSLKSYVRRIENKYRRTDEPDIPQESAQLPELVEGTPALSPAEDKLMVAGILKDNRKDRIPDKTDRLSFKEKRKYIMNEAETLIDGLVGVIKSGDILKSLKKDKCQINKHIFSDNVENLVNHGQYLRYEN